MLYVMKDSKVKGKFTRMVSEGRVKPKLVSENGDLRKRKEPKCAPL